MRFVSIILNLLALLSYPWFRFQFLSIHILAVNTKHYLYCVYYIRIYSKSRYLIHKYTACKYSIFKYIIYNAK